MDKRTLTARGLLTAVFFGSSLSVIVTLIMYMYELTGNGRQGTGIITALILAPVCEELIFRKIIYMHILRRKLKAGKAYAAVTASIAFAVCHSTAPAVAIAFIFSLACCLCYEQTGTILFTMAMHISFNAASLLLTVLPEGFASGMMLICSIMLIIMTTALLRKATPDRVRAFAAMMSKERREERCISSEVLLKPFKKECDDWRRIGMHINEVRRNGR